MWKFMELRPGQLERKPHEMEFFNVAGLRKIIDLPVLERDRVNRLYQSLER